MPSRALLGRTRARRLAPYLKGRKHSLAYSVGSDAVIVAEQEYLFTLYRVAVTASDGTRYRHLLVVPTNISAVSFDVGLALAEEDSLEADTGCFEGVAQIASALRWSYSRYRTFPPPSTLNRFCM